jgi:hypothetical protein
MFRGGLPLQSLYSVGHKVTVGGLIGLTAYSLYFFVTVGADTVERYNVRKEINTVRRLKREVRP